MHLFLLLYCTRVHIVCTTSETNFILSLGVQCTYTKAMLHYIVVDCEWSMEKRTTKAVWYVWMYLNEWKAWQQTRLKIRRMLKLTLASKMIIHRKNGRIWDACERVVLQFYFCLYIVPLNRFRLALSLSLSDCFFARLRFLFG